MSVILVRKENETPNIQNTDDIRAFKYATCNRSGVVKNYLNQISYEIDGRVFRLKSGEIILDSWQVKLDVTGAEITVNAVSGNQYYSIYLEVDLSISDNKKVAIKASYDTYAYPTISRGDDISVNASGVARLLLYNVLVVNQVITTVTRKFDYIDGQVADSIHADQSDLATNAMNAVKKSNGTFETLLQNISNELLTVGNNSVVQSKSLFYNLNSTSRTVSLSNVNEGDTIEVVLKVNLTSLGYIFILPAIKYKIGKISTASNTFSPDLQFNYSIHYPSNTKEIIYGEISITNTDVTTLIGANKLTFTKANTVWTPTWTALDMAQSSQLEYYPVIVSVRKIIE